MKPSGQLRIIGGRWRSRRLRVAKVDGLRPSPDAVRETVFNWLAHHRGLARMNCLDLFAGAGAFGFEAASRGATRVVMVESHPLALATLRANCESLQCDSIEIVGGDVERFLTRRDATGGFDLVFIDPPFASTLQQRTCDLLCAHGWLNPQALVYIESPSAERPLPPPQNWRIIRQQSRGMVRATLLQT